MNAFLFRCLDNAGCFAFLHEAGGTGDCTVINRAASASEENTFQSMPGRTMYKQGQLYLMPYDMKKSYKIYLKGGTSFWVMTSNFQKIEICQNFKNSYLLDRS